MAEDTLSKVKLLLGIKDKLQDELLTLLVSDSQERLVSYINQDSDTDIKFPTGIDWVLREITVRRYNRIGDEGKTSSNESGADVKIMDRLFWHREVPHSENFSKPGFQLKTA